MVSCNPGNSIRFLASPVGARVDRPVLEERVGELLHPARG